MNESIIWLTAMMSIETQVLASLEIDKLLEKEEKENKGRKEQGGGRWFQNQAAKLRLKMPAASDISRMQQYRTSIRNIWQGKGVHDVELKEIARENYNGKARTCVEDHYLRFLDYEIKYLHDLPDIDEQGNVKFKREPSIRKHLVWSDPVPIITRSDTYIATYLSDLHESLTGFVELFWGIGKEGEWPFRATMKQLSKDGKELEFHSTNGITSRNKGKKARSKLLFIQFEGRLDPVTSKDDFNTSEDNPEDELETILFQCVIDLPLTKSNVVYGTFSSVRSTILTPVAGAVLLHEAKVQEYEALKNSKFPKKGQTSPVTTEEQLERQSLSQYFLSEKLIIPTESLFNDIKNLPNYDNWKEFSNSFLKTYSGYFHLQSGPTFHRPHFSVVPSAGGTCELTISMVDRNATKTIVVPGTVRLENSVLHFSFIPTNDYKGHFLKFWLPADKTGTILGMYCGLYPRIGLDTFQSGVVQLVPETQNGEDTAVSTKETGVPDVKQDEQMIFNDYHKLLTNSWTNFPDGALLHRILRKQNPVAVHNQELLMGLKLSHHYKYLTFRVPENNVKGSTPGETFRIEKCDVKFSEDFSKVTISSPAPRDYNGRVYYNGVVLLLILNPQVSDDDALKDSYFTIQLDLPWHSNRESGPEIIFGTSTWKDVYLESKMVVLVKAAVTEQVNTQSGKIVRSVDNETKIYRIGTNGALGSSKYIEEILQQDRIYNGAFSYLFGRINRHIHTSSKTNNVTPGFGLSNGGAADNDFFDDEDVDKIEMLKIFRPRDKTSREPYIYAGMHLAGRLDIAKDEKKPAIRQSAERYFFEGFLHQFGCTHLAGEVLTKEYFASITDRIPKELRERCTDLLLEQQYLTSFYKGLRDKDLRKFLKKLWPYLDTDAQSLPAGKSNP
ncbi:hypothetical protein LZD49_02815 [Dyadobacter sp. CY261]|uniref:hypothetical protein n=1 Tax=Dyadobacter sp. CY261 TaxID=2907203 RepID=UPI001F3D4329|nr:hypothetical protein [Dyadobacter sp. CY261]MCF0069384.1 hypothetical protein [Dyadobacter sp. CY261]